MTAELNARQRKNVYMHSTIFDDAGPSSSSVYAPKRQAEVFATVEGTLGKTNKPPPPDLSMPSAADIRSTQNAGHGVVMQSGGYPGGGGGRVEGFGGAVSIGQSPNAISSSDGGEMPVVYSSAKDKHRQQDSAIPKEFWNTSVQLSWSDPRNEMRRGRDRPQMSAQDQKRNELSSEIFGTERQTQPSTRNPKQELMANTAQPLQTDSALDKNTASREGGGDARGRFVGNLNSSEGNTMPKHANGGVPLASTRGWTPQEEDPNTMDRRRGEKNFSDLFGHQVQPPARDGARHELTATRACSFLDTRGEIASRNQGKWKGNDNDDHADVSQQRKDAELDSNLFGFQRPPVERTSANANRERACWDTRDVMTSGSEIARRTRGKMFEEDLSAPGRKQQELSGEKFRVGLGQEPIPTSSDQGGRMRNVPAGAPIRTSAKDTKQAFLQSSIFA